MKSQQPLFENFFDNFTHSCAAARALLQKAHDQGNLIEGLILYAALTDAFLRNMLAIKTGGKVTDSTTVYFGSIALDSDLFRHSSKRWFSEREIFRMALAANVVSEDEFQVLNDLYSFRNRIVHRFITSDVSYSDIAPRLIQYEHLYETLYEKLALIEKQPPASAEQRRTILEGIMRKINRPIS